MAALIIPMQAGQAELPTSRRVRSDVAGNRAQPEFDPAGIEAGGFRLYPALQLGLRADSNEFNREKNIQSDVSAQAAPSLTAASRWSRHDLRLEADGQFLRYADLGDQNLNLYSFAASGRIDVDHATTIEPRAAYARDFDRRGSGGNRLTGGEPLSFRSLTADLRVRRELGRAVLVATGGYERLRYENFRGIGGRLIDQQYRDTDRLEATARAEVEIGPALALTATGSANQVEAGHQGFDALRNSHGYSALGGVRFDVGGLIVGEAAAGYRSQSFRNPKFQPVRGPTFSARIDYYPTPLISIGVLARQSFQNSGLVDVSAVLERRLALNVDYELMRNLLIRSDVLWVRNNYRERATITHLKTINVRATYDFSRMLAVEARIGGRFNTSSDRTIAAPYTGVEFGSALLLRL